MKHCFHLAFSVVFLLVMQVTPSWSQGKNSDKVAAGPMIGYADFREVMLWVQTTEPSEVWFRYREAGQEKGGWMETSHVQTDKSQAFTAHCLADQVQPGSIYEAQLYVDRKQVDLKHPLVFRTQTLWQWRSDPPPFKMVIGSCAFVSDSLYDRPGEPYGGGYHIFEAMADQNPDLMLWLGDNMYLREADWNTRTGIHYRYSKNRSLPEMQRLLSTCSHYAIWDDHDYGPNDADRSFIHKDKTLEAFKLFWANPSYGLEDQGGITGRFSWSDCDFFLLDDRYFRAPNFRVTGERTMFGKAQLEWLIDALKSSRAPFKFVATGGMILSTAAVHEDYIRLFPEEREWLLNRIQEEGIGGVIFLTGDRHHTEMTKWHPKGGLPIYDITISPLTSGSYPGDGDQNKYLMEGTLVEERNFGVLEVTGSRNQRKLRIAVYNSKGKELWGREIEANEMHR